MSGGCPKPEEVGRAGRPDFWRRSDESRFGSFDLIEPGISLVRFVCWLVHVAARAIFHPLT